MLLWSCCLIYSCKNYIGELKQTITPALLALLTSATKGKNCTDNFSYQAKMLLVNNVVKMMF